MRYIALIVLALALAAGCGSAATSTPTNSVVSQRLVRRRLVPPRPLPLPYPYPYPYPYANADAYGGRAARSGYAASEDFACCNGPRCLVLPAQQ
jgi:hypothetical protein